MIPILECQLCVISWTSRLERGGVSAPSVHTFSCLVQTLLSGCIDLWVAWHLALLTPSLWCLGLLWCGCWLSDVVPVWWPELCTGVDWTQHRKVPAFCWLHSAIFIFHIYIYLFIHIYTHNTVSKLWKEVVNNLRCLEINQSINQINVVSAMWLVQCG